MTVSRFIRAEWLQILILILPFVFAAIYWNQLPDRIPIHWDLHGNANGYSGKVLGLLLLPTINVGLALLLLALPKIDPKAVKTATAAMKPVRLIVTAFLTVVFIHTTLASQNAGLSIGNSVMIELPVLFVALGIYLPRIHPNYFVGVRVPWTLEDPENWRATHNFTGKLWIVISIVYIACVIVAGGNIPEWAVFIFIGVIAVPPIVYSFVYFRQHSRT